MAHTSAFDDACEYYHAEAKKQPYPATTPGYKDADPLAYEMSGVPMRTPRPLKVICCGAGFSGLEFAHEVESGSLKNVSLTIYEKNSSLGGTWFENQYPG